MFPSVGLWSLAFPSHNHMLYVTFPLLQHHIGFTWTVHCKFTGNEIMMLAWPPNFLIEIFLCGRVDYWLRVRHCVSVYTCIHVYSEPVISLDDALIYWH